MGEYAVPIIVALLGLAGTIAGLILGYRKWVQERHTEHSKAFRADRQGAYKQLWERAEQLNVDGRIAEIPDEEFSRRVAEINAFMLTSNVYLDDSDRGLVNSYIRAARAFHEAVRSSDDAGAEVALGETQDIPQGALQRSQAISETQQKALELRASLLQKVRSVVAGVE